ncbi:unnamed protein product [Closterium sp. NIES-54]
MTTLRVLLHVAAQRDYELHSLDFSTAFLQGSLREEIWLCRPPGFTGSFPPGTQWSLRRPVYGLCQASREWHDTLRTTLAALGFAPSTVDPSLFLRTDTLLPPFYILVYVDDLVFSTADTAGLAHVKYELQKRHTCTDLGELCSYLGLQITRHRVRRTITLTQSHMVQQVLQRFDFTYSSPQATPLSTRHSLSALPSDESVEPSGPYPELVGCLMYLMTCTRPDLAYPLSILARYVAPGRHRPEHMAAAKRVLRYLCSTSGMGLVLGGRSPLVLTGHADASWVDDLATQRSSQGYTFSLGSSSVSWRSTRSSSVLSSSCEAEIYAGAMAAQELRWLTYLLTDLGEPPRSPPVLRAAQPSHAAQQSRAAQPSRAAPPSRTSLLSRTALPSCTALHCLTASASTVATLANAPTAAMASPTVLTFDAEGRAVDFDVWVDVLHLFLHCDSRDGVSLFDHTSGVSTAPAAIANIARYSSPATAALSRLMLPYLFPDLAAFTTVADLVTHLRTSDARYRAAIPTETTFSHFAPTELTVDLLEERLAVAEKSILAVGASRGDRRTPFFEGCSPVPLLPSVASVAAVDLIGIEEVGAASSPNGRHRNSKSKGSKGGGGGGGGAVEEVEEAEEVAVEVGVVPGVGASVAAVEVVEAVTEVVEAATAVVEVAAAVVLAEVQPRSVEALVAASASSSCAPVRPRRSNSFVSGGAGRGRSGGAGPCTYVLRSGTCSGEVCGLPCTTQRCFGRLTDAWRAQFPDVVELPRWHDLLLQNVPIFDIDFDAILAAMYALADSAEGDCCLSVPPDPGIAAAALGASASAAPGTGASAAPGAGASPLSGTAPTESLHTFTLDSGSSRSFFRDSTTLRLLSRPVAVSLADPSGGPVLAHSSTVLPCPAAPSGLLSGLHLPSFSTNLVSGADLQDAWVDQFTPGGQRVTHCTCSRTGHHLATFTRRPGSSLYTLTTAPSPVPVSGQVAASSQVLAAASRSSPASAPCSCHPLSHETLLWHHRLGHPSLPRLRGMASRALVSGLPRSLPPLPPGPAPTCVPCVEGQKRVAHHSSSFPPTEAPLQTLHMDVKGEVPESDRGWEFSSDLLRDFCRSEGIRQTFMLPASPQQNGIAERRIGMVMDVARTSMIHAAAPHFLWPFAVQYAAHQINIQPRVSLPETTPTLRWTGKVGDASAFRVWGSRAFVRDTTVDKLSSRAVPCVFLGFPPDAPGWQFYHPTSRRVVSSQDVTFDESGPAPSGVSQVDPAEPVEVAVDSGATRGAEPAGAGTGVAGTGGAEPERVEPGGAESGCAELGRVGPEGAVSGGAEPARAESGGGLGVLSRREPLSPQHLREWYSRRSQGAAGAGAAAAEADGGAAGAGSAAGAAGAGAAGGAAGAGAAGAAGGTARAAGGSAGTGGAAGAGAAGGAAGAGGAGAAGGAAGTGDPRAEGTGPVSTVSGGVARPRPYYIPLLQQVLGSLPSPGPPPPFLSPPPVQSQSQFQPASPLPGPSPYSGPTRGLKERREPESRPVSSASRSASPICTVRAGRVSRPRSPPVPGTHSMNLRPSTPPQRVPLPSPPASSLPAGPDPASDSLRAASLAVMRFLATAITDPLFESTAASALVTELVHFAAAYRLNYATSLVAESASASVCPPSVGGECALGTDVLEDKQEEFECFAAAVPHLVSMLIAPEGDPDAPDIPTPRSYAEAIEGPYSSQWQATLTPRWLLGSPQAPTSTRFPRLGRTSSVPCGSSG